MASTMCKSAVRVASRTLANRSNSFTAKPSSPFLFSLPSSTNIPRALRILSVKGSVESLMPLHSAIANARLTSNIALASTCWSMLSRGALVDINPVFPDGLERTCKNIVTGMLDPFKLKDKTKKRES